MKGLRNLRGRLTVAWPRPVKKPDDGGGSPMLAVISERTICQQPQAVLMVGGGRWQNAGRGSEGPG